MIDMYDNPLHPPAPTTIDYFDEKDVEEALESKKIHFILSKFLFYSANPNQTSLEKQANWNNLFKAVKHASQDIISLRRKLHAKRSRPTVTNIGSELMLKGTKNYPINTLED